MGSSPIPATIGPLVKRLRHRPFTAVTAVRFCYGSPAGKARLQFSDGVRRLPIQKIQAPRLGFFYPGTALVFFRKEAAFGGAQNNGHYFLAFYGTAYGNRRRFLRVRACPLAFEPVVFLPGRPQRKSRLHCYGIDWNPGSRTGARFFLPDLFP